MALGLCLALVLTLSSDCSLVWDRLEPNYGRDVCVWSGNKQLGSLVAPELGVRSTWSTWLPSDTACLTDSTDTWRAPCMSHCRSTGPCMMQEAFSLLPLSVSPSARCSAVKIDQQTLAFSSFFCLSLSLGSHQVQRLPARVPHFLASVFVLPRLKRVGVYTLFSACVCVYTCQPGLFHQFALHSTSNKSGILVSQWFFWLLSKEGFWRRYSLAAAGGLTFADIAL